MAYKRHEASRAAGGKNQAPTARIGNIYMEEITAAVVSGTRTTQEAGANKRIKNLDVIDSLQKILLLN
jgi:hypothetical protein